MIRKYHFTDSNGKTVWRFAYDSSLAEEKKAAIAFWLQTLTPEQRELLDDLVCEVRQDAIRDDIED